jgi:phage tail protein X
MLLSSRDCDRLRNALVSGAFFISNALVINMQKKKAIFFVSILVVGLLASWPFRKQTGRNAPFKPQDSPSIFKLHAPVPLQVSPITEVSPAAKLQWSSQKRPTGKLENHAEIRAKPGSTPSSSNHLDRTLTVPDLAAHYQPHFTDGNLQNEALSNPANRSVADEPTQRFHRIRDGDTLDTIAREYFGNPDRANEIFDANRQLLKHPDLLPVGTEIAIPPDSTVQ